MSRTEQLKNDCQDCVYKDNTYLMCDTCILGTNFLPKEKKIEVILCAAITADGFIAKHSDHVCSWTPKADKDSFKKFTRDVGVVIMGSKTYDTLTLPLSKRLNIVMSRDTTRIRKYPHVVFTNKKPVKILHALSKKGYTRVCVTGGSEINTEFLRRELIDKIQITVIPKLFGTGISLFKNLNLDIDLIEDNREDIGDGCIKLMYNVQYKENKNDA